MRVCGSASEPRAAFLGHGGRLREAMAAWPQAPLPWLDLSTGVNPKAYPAPRATHDARARLPDPVGLADLEEAAGRAFGARPKRVCATAGAEAALHLLAQSLPVRSVAIVGSTYGGHAQAWAAAGVAVTSVARAEAAEAEAVVLVNPNNPDGRRLTAERVQALAAQLSLQGRWLIVDESFVETAPELSVALQAGERLVVIRSFGKFYGLAGLRLGFVVGDPALLTRLRARQGDWPVSADAMAAGLRAYPDARWAMRTRRRLVRDAARLDDLLSHAGCEVLGGTPLFRLVRTADVGRRFERLARRGVLVRPFAHAPDQIRFGLPPRGTWRRLEAGLMESAA